ncbi:MAG: NADH-quinone oxidoreductase subunit C [Candidatus Tectomicrobia bacterium]|nr:NADH-quinone oxidoreductase subunit C [Candidatus Tectomicrobia bacterium]
MEEHAERAVMKLRERFGEALREVQEFRGEMTVLVAAARLVDICRVLRDDPELRFEMLTDVTAADYVQQRNVFTVVYHLYSFLGNARLRLKADVPAEHPSLPSLTSLWPAANWHERETYDLFGIQFEGHPDLRRILMPEDFTDFPLRKEFPLQGR